MSANHERHNLIRWVVVMAIVLTCGLLATTYGGKLIQQPRDLHHNKYVDANGDIVREPYTLIRERPIGLGGISHYAVSLKEEREGDPLHLWERLLLIWRLPLNELMADNYGCVYHDYWDHLSRVKHNPDFAYVKGKETVEQQKIITEYAQAIAGANPGINVSNDDFVFEKMFHGWDIRLFGRELHDIGPLRGFPNLRQLVLANCEVADLAVLSSFPELEYLILYNVPKVTDISALASLSKLSFLVLWNTDVTDLRPLQNLSKLNIINLTGNKHLTDIAPLAGRCHDMVSVFLEATKVKDVSPLAQCHNLLNVNLDGTPVEDISSLPSNVRYLTVANSEVRDISRLGALPRLTAFYFYNTPAYWRQLTCYIVIPGLLVIWAAAAIAIRKLRS